MGNIIVDGVVYECFYCGEPPQGSKSFYACCKGGRESSLKQQMRRDTRAIEAKKPGHEPKGILTSGKSRLDSEKE